MKMRFWSALLILVLVAAGLSAQDQMSAEEKAMMEAWMKAATPGDAHKKLEPFVGNWDVKVKSWMSPGAPVMESTGSAETRWILGGRYIEEKFQGNFMGQPFNGVGYTGYDNTRKQYSSTWMDNMSTAVMHSAGLSDPSGKVMAFAATMADPTAGGKDVRIEMRITVPDNDHHMMEMWGPAPDGKMYRSMEISYTRKR